MDCVTRYDNGISMADLAIIGIGVLAVQANCSIGTTLIINKVHHHQSYCFTIRMKHCLV